MLHAMFQDYRPFGSGFFKVFTIYGRVGHLGHVTWNIMHLSILTPRERGGGGGGGGIRQFRNIFD